MGYSEIACQICGVSFNIGRIRTPTEPRSAGWNYNGRYPGSYVRRHSESSRFCPPSAGCMVVNRRDRVNHHTEVPDHAIADDDDDGDGDENDNDYVLQSLEDLDDPYEYDSQYETESDTATDDDGDAMSCSSGSSGSSETYRAFVQCLAPAAIPSEVMIPEHDAPENGEDFQEHIAGGLGCQWNKQSILEGAFNGHAISAEEMRGCSTLQCFVPKEEDWESESDDEEYERSGKFFLSGLCDASPSRDMDWPEASPDRHGCSTLKADNTFYNMETAGEYCMPFHPTCLEVFKRASLMRTGAVDYEGLINWWIVEAGDGCEVFRRDPAVNHQQWFEHVDGDEFLAANPCFATKLQSILAAADRTGDTSFTYDMPVFVEKLHTSSDVFARLPRELRFMVLDQLESGDVANLRASSRSFYQLPQSFFRALTLRELPWLWEAWCDLEYSQWAYTGASELRYDDEQHAERTRPNREAQRVLQEEARNAPEGDLHQDVILALQQVIDKEEEERYADAIMVPLQVSQKTDWYRLRCELARNRTSLLGLKNRRRIWTDCEEILDRIARYRGDGTMILGQMADAREVARVAMERRIEQNRRWHNYCQAGRPGTYNFDDWA
ncbi:hypothetical protein E8E14_008347 [Neopestalotiopsis sp. 37M]|nr:hypothetical protein E8E14_008347 [Neopestalotiopsis sp. 37M]